MTTILMYLLAAVGLVMLALGSIYSNREIRALRAQRQMLDNALRSARANELRAYAEAQELRRRVAPVPNLKLHAQP